MSKFSNLKSNLMHKYFDWDVKNALGLKAINRVEGRHEDLCVLSMLCKRDFYQYLISIHSFASLFNPEKIVIVNDGSLERWHVAHLKSFIDDVVILNGTDFVDKRVPTYTSWRRMLAIESFVSRYYVIQLDADLLSRHNLSEVKHAYQNNYSFILGTECENLSTLGEAKQAAIDRNQPTNGHVQHQSELNLDALHKIGFSHYVRGCAGFAGYAKGSFSKDTLIRISNCMFSRIGEKWREWGSEQTAANMMISNMPGAKVLPLSYYGSVARYTRELKLIHFLGTWRFQGLLYNKLAKQYISENLKK
jgi:hypothetical protein